ncbi:MAG TPA: ribonuclease HII [Rhodanobacteraceae bacterium]|jgi:ribonuclease HII|nr:ribonuclease HII [Rhodanobacteraceae bacterium]
MTLVIDNGSDFATLPRHKLRRWPDVADLAGVDEAGCAPLAGPVVVAAVILDPARRINGLDDSKVLPEPTREKLYARIVERARAWSVVAVEVAEIDRINIYHARMAGMLRALERLACAPAFALIDGNRLPRPLPCPARAVVDGDALAPAISAASIIAKVTRDRMMRELDTHWPGYGFAQHKGYPTPAHCEALRRLGPCPHHRRSFAPVRAALEQELPLALPA